MDAGLNVWFWCLIFWNVGATWCEGVILIKINKWINKHDAINGGLREKISLEEGDLGGVHLETWMKYLCWLSVSRT